MKKPLESPWSIRIGAFATAVGVPADDVEKAFASLVGEPGDEALIILSDKTAVPDEDIKNALAEFKIPSGKLNIHLPKLRDEKPVEEKTETVSSGTTTTLSILPTVPDEQSFLEMLKTGGTLKVGTTEVLSAIKAALAQTVGLYKIPEKILDKMEAFAIAQEEPCGEAFYSMQKLKKKNTKYFYAFSTTKQNEVQKRPQNRSHFSLSLPPTRTWPPKNHV